MNGALLQALISPDNDIRRAAETTYAHQCGAAPAEVAQALLGAITAPGLAPHLRNLAAVLLRRLISGLNSRWDDMGASDQEVIRSALLRLVHDEDDDGLRKKI